MKWKHYMKLEYALFSFINFYLDQLLLLGRKKEKEKLRKIKHVFLEFIYMNGNFHKRSLYSVIFLICLFHFSFCFIVPKVKSRA